MGRNNSFVKVLFRSTSKLLASSIAMFALASVGWASESYKWELASEIESNIPYTGQLENAHFGFAIDVYGEYAVVGSPGDSGRLGIHSIGEGHGRAYVFKRESEQWNMVASFAAPADDIINFGIEVSISENLIAIGAAMHDDGYGSYGHTIATDSRVYLYEKTGGEWAPSKPVAVLNGLHWDDVVAFGSALDIEDNIIVVGSRYLDGSVYVFEKPDTGWQGSLYPSARLTDSETSHQGGLGSSVRLLGNSIVATQDGKPELLVFKKSGANWGNAIESYKVDLSNYFDEAFNISSYVLSSDGQTLVVSSGSNRYESSGVAVVLQEVAGIWVPIQSIIPPEIDILFGFRTVVDGNQLVVLSTKKSGLIKDYTLYYYKKSDIGVWEFKHSLLIPVDNNMLFPAANRQLDLQDSKIVLGFPWDDSIESNAGMVKEFHIVDDKIIEQDTTALPEYFISQAFSSFGQSVDIQDDIAVVGAPGEDGHRGAVYLYQKSGSLWQLVKKLVPAELNAWDEFGYAVDIDGDKLAVGAPGRLFYGYGGKAFVYTKPGSGWADVSSPIVVQQPFKEDLTHDRGYGQAIALSGDSLAVGAPYFSYSAVYTYDLSTGSANQTARFADELLNFGRSLAWSGRSLAIGSDTNAITLYNKPSSNWQKQGVLVSSDILAGYNTLSASDNWIVAGNYKRFGYHTSGNLNAIIFKRPESGWVSMNEHQIINLTDPDDYNSAASIAFDGDTLAALGAGKLGLYKLHNDQWTLSENIDADFPYVGRFGDYQVSRKFPVNALALDTGHALVGRYWEDSSHDLDVGKLHIFSKKLTANIAFDDVTQPLSDGLFQLNAVTNSSAPITFEILGGALDVIQLDGKLVTPLKAGTVEITAKVESTEQYASNSVTKSITITKGQAVISNFNDMTLFKGLPPVTLSATTNSDGEISYAPLVFIGADGTFDTGMDLLSGSQILPNRAGTLYLRAKVNETENYLEDTETIVVMILDM